MTPLPTLKREYATVELADGQVLEVRIINPDVIRYEETAQKHGWPAPTMNSKTQKLTMPVLDYGPTFKAWAALRRTGQYEGTWEQFRDVDCVQVALEDGEDVDPTQPAPDSDSAPSSPGSDDDPLPSYEMPTTPSSPPT